MPQRDSGMTVPRTICLGFIGAIAIGAILLWLPFSTADGTWSDPITALFTATSATCVTGLIVVDTGSYYSRFGQLIILLLIQVGGLGYMSATTFLLLLVGRKFRLREKLAIQQSLDTPGLSGVVQLVKSIIATTLLFELTGVFLLILEFRQRFSGLEAIWQSIFHSISAFNNAGFSLFSNSLMGYARSPLLNLVITVLIIFGGIGYQTIMDIYAFGRDRLFKNAQRFRPSLHFRITLSTTVVLLLLGTIAFYSTEFSNPNTLGRFAWNSKLLAAWFQSVTTRTAGFNTIDTGTMTTAGLFITIAFMFIGASPGSTGGGIKTTTLRVLVSCTKSVLQGRDEVLCYQRQIPVELVMKSVGVVMGSVGTVIVATILVALSDPQLEFIQILFEVVSAFATVGLSMGITAQLSVWGKLIIIATMYIGRVGVLLLMSALLGDPSPSLVDYPEEDLLIG